MEALTFTLLMREMLTVLKDMEHNNMEARHRGVDSEGLLKEVFGKKIVEEPDRKTINVISRGFALGGKTSMTREIYTTNISA